MSRLSFVYAILINVGMVPYTYNSEKNTNVITTRIMYEKFLQTRPFIYQNIVLLFVIVSGCIRFRL